MWWPTWSLEVDKAANKVADMVPDMVADMVADKKKQEKMTNMELTRLAHLLKLCEFIVIFYHF